MKLATVQIAGQPVEIHRVKEIWVDDEPCDGAYHPGTRTIEIKQGIRGPDLHDTLIHELAHAVVDLYGLELGDAEERVCLAMGRGLASGLGHWLKQIRRVKEDGI